MWSVYLCTEKIVTPPTLLPLPLVLSLLFLCYIWMVTNMKTMCLFLLTFLVLVEVWELAAESVEREWGNCWKWGREWCIVVHHFPDTSRIDICGPVIIYVSHKSSICRAPGNSHVSLDLSNFNSEHMHLWPMTVSNMPDGRVAMFCHQYLLIYSS